jgi:hypothetical protein
MQWLPLSSSSSPSMNDTLSDFTLNLHAAPAGMFRPTDFSVEQFFRRLNYQRNKLQNINLFFLKRFKPLIVNF